MPVEPPEVDPWPEKQGKEKNEKENLINNIPPPFPIQKIILPTFRFHQVYWL